MEKPVELDTKWLGRLLKKHYKDEEPADIINVNVEPAVPKGENYASIVMRVKINILTHSGSRKTVSLIVKSAVTSEGAKEVFKEFPDFKYETKMFITTLKQMEALMEEFEDKRDTLWATLYGYEPYSIMVLEDLKEKNFALIDRTGWQDLDHSLLVLRSLGRYHAMTKVLIGRGLIDQSDKGHYFAGVNSPVMTKLFNGGVHMLSKALINKLGSWPAGWEDIGKRIQKQKDVLCNTLEELYINYDKKFDVLNHGDVWSSNMMFKKMEYTNIPVAVKFVDYQTPNLGSFMWDVIYFLHTSVKPSIRRPNVEVLLKAYHESLTDNLKFFKFQGDIPSFEDVKNEASRLRPAAFAFFSVIMPITVASTNEAVDFDKIATHPPEDVFNQEIFTEEKFVKEIADDLKDFVKLGVI
uniref:CHK kinase-like domain-containing protein n=1 Tax=Lygus hesperus TaxID=30085 RepID=A0A146KWR4_LYGHE